MIDWTIIRLMCAKLATKLLIYDFWSANSIDFLYVQKYDTTVFNKYNTNKRCMSSGILGF